MNNYQILDNADIFLMLSQLFVNPRLTPVRVMLSNQNNRATSDLLLTTMQFWDDLIDYRGKYDEFCRNLAKLGNFSNPYTIDDISADWYVPYLLINNDLGSLTYLFMVLTMLPEGAKVTLPIEYPYNPQQAER